MMDNLMTKHRGRVVAVLVGLFGLVVLLWFIRGPAPDFSNLAFFAVSLALIPIAGFAVYGILYLTVRAYPIREDVLRGVCTFLFVAGALVLAVSALLAIYDFATHRSQPSPGVVSLGVALGAMEAWGLLAKPPARG